MSDIVSADKFWEIIECGRKEGESEKELALRLENALSTLDADSILQWGNIYELYHSMANKGKLWGAANIMDDGFCSDDGFHYFRAWLIGQGRDIYMAALNDPDSLSKLPVQKDVRFERVNYAAYYAYEKMTGKDYYDEIKKRDVPVEVVAEVQMGVNYCSDIDDVKYINGRYPRVYPKLTAAYDNSTKDEK